MHNVRVASKYIPRFDASSTAMAQQSFYAFGLAESTTYPEQHTHKKMDIGLA